MLKAHQACIDLQKNVLRIQGREVRFLAEHELPEKARIMEEGIDESVGSLASSSTAPAPAAGPSQPFPGSGHTLGGPPVSIGATRNRGPAAPAPGQTMHSEEAIQTLIGLGATRDLAIRTLDAANGNLDVAASLLF